MIFQNAAYGLYERLELKNQLYKILKYYTEWGGNLERLQKIWDSGEIPDDDDEESLYSDDSEDRLKDFKGILNYNYFKKVSTSSFMDEFFVEFCLKFS